MAAFLFFELLYQKLADFNMFATWNPQKFLHEQLVDLPTSRISCSHCTLGNPNSHFSAMLSIHDSDYFCYTRIKWTASITVQLNHITVTWAVLYRDMLLTPELLSAIRSIGDVFVFQQDNAPAHRARDTVELLRCETAHFISPDMWPANSRDLNPVYCCNWDMMQKRVYQVPIRDTDELRQRLVET